MSHKTTHRSKNQSSSPAIPGYSGYRAGYSGPHCPECPGAVSGMKIRVSRSLRVYTRSLRVPFHPTAIFGLKTVNTPSIPLQPPLLPLWRAELKPKPKRALSLSLLHSWVIPLRDLSEKQARVRISTSEPHFHLLSTWFWSSPRIQVCYSWSLVLLDG